MKEKINNIVEKSNGEISISTHPFVASYINQKKGWFSNSISKNWSKKFNRKITVRGDDRLHLLQYSVVKN